MATVQSEFSPKRSLVRDGTHGLEQPASITSRISKAIEKWKKEVLPEIKKGSGYKVSDGISNYGGFWLSITSYSATTKKVRNLNATLGLEDEAGFTMVAPLNRTWARCEQMPVWRTSIHHHARLNILGVLLVLPKGKKIRLSIKSYRYPHPPHFPLILPAFRLIDI